MPVVYDEDKGSWAAGPAIANVAATAAASPTTAEFNAVVTALNSLLAVCRDAGLIAQD